jgi:hypothetical protein
MHMTPAELLHRLTDDIPAHSLAATTQTDPSVPMVGAASTITGRRSTGGAGKLARGSALDAKVVADAVWHRQIPSGQLGGEGLECQEQSFPCHIDDARRAEWCATRDPHRGPRADDLLEEWGQGVAAERRINCG